MSPVTLVGMPPLIVTLPDAVSEIAASVMPMKSGKKNLIMVKVIWVLSAQHLL